MFVDKTGLILPHFYQPDTKQREMMSGLGLGLLSIQCPLNNSTSIFMIAMRDRSCLRGPPMSPC